MTRMFGLSLLLSFARPFIVAERHQVPFQHETSPLTEDFSQRVKWTMDKWHIPGLSIAIVDRDETWSEGYGFAILPDIPATPRTLYYGGSLAKSHTAAAMSILISSGNFSGLSWQTPISNIIREDFVLEDAWATEHVTIEDVLSHRSGMARHDMSYGGDYGGHMGTPRDVVRSLRYLPLSAEPRQTFHYSNIMYVTMCHVIETIAGQELGDFLKERLWEPLGMRHTYFSHHDALKHKELARGYSWQRSTGFKPAPFENTDVLTGAASLISNVLDVAKWLKAFMEHSPPLTHNDYKELKSPRTFVTKQPHDAQYDGFMMYALGWEVDFYHGYQVFMHTGEVEAFGCHQFCVPELKWGAVACANTPSASRYASVELIQHLLAEKVNLSKEERFDWLAYHEEMVRNHQQNYNNLQQTYYPATLDLRPLSLELERYAGTYWNPGFRNMTVVYKDGKLQIDRYASSQVHMDLEHVTGDYFMAWTDSITIPKSVFQWGCAAEFVVGPDGIARKFGLAEELTMGVDGRIWFERIE